MGEAPFHEQNTNVSNRSFAYLKMLCDSSSNMI